MDGQCRYTLLCEQHMGMPVHSVEWQCLKYGICCSMCITLCSLAHLS